MELRHVTENSGNFVTGWPVTGPQKRGDDQHWALLSPPTHSHLFSSRALTLQAREHRGLQLNLCSRKHTFPRTRKSVRFFHEAHHRALLWGSAVRKPQHTEREENVLGPRKCQGLFWSLPVQVGKGAARDKKPLLPWGFLSVSTWWRIIGCTRQSHALSISQKLRGPSCEGHHLKNWGATISNVKMKDYISAESSSSFCVLLSYEAGSAADRDAGHRPYRQHGGTSRKTGRVQLYAGPTG